MLSVGAVRADGALGRHPLPLACKLQREEAVEALRHLVEAVPLRIGTCSRSHWCSSHSVTNITLVFFCQEIHPLTDHKIEKAVAQRLKELLGELIRRCRQECGTPEILVVRRDLPKLEAGSS